MVLRHCDGTDDSSSYMNHCVLYILYIPHPNLDFIWIL